MGLSKRRGKHQQLISVWPDNARNAMNKYEVTMSRQNLHKGQSFDDFLEEDGILAEAQALAVKRVLAFQIEKAMKKRAISKTTMAKMMHTSRTTLNRLLDPLNTSITLNTLVRAASVMGKHIEITIK
jgi:antitoxin HicB